jgi:hypothetical protein
LKDLWPNWQCQRGLKGKGKGGSVKRLRSDPFVHLI